MKPANPKLCSGRFWLAIIAGLVFARCAVNGTLDAQTIGMIILVVFQSYFGKRDHGGAA